MRTKFLLPILLLSLISTPCLSETVESTRPYVRILMNSPLEHSSPQNNCNAEICSALLSLIINAKSTIDFAIYGLRGQDAILGALTDAQERGVLVRGIIDKDISNKNYYSDTHLLETSLNQIKTDYLQDRKTAKYFQNRKTAKRSNSKSKNGKKKCERPSGQEGPLQCFDTKGYASKAPITFKGDIMHNKFFIVDKKYIWTGSSNVSDTGTGGYNANIVAVIRSDFLAKNYLVEFEQMFRGHFHRAKKQLKKKNIEVKIDGQKVNLFFSPQGYAMYKGVIPLIKESKRTIDVAVFFLTHKNVSKELVLAKKRGVQVRVILDATAATNGYSKHNYLREHGILVKVEDWGGKMHMKSALIDNKHLIIGSMNWTSAGESKNDENTLIIRNSRDAPSYTKFYNKMWDSISDEWLDNDPKAESIESGSSCSDRIDNDFDHLVDNDDAGC
jgi:phosphatidylserine/phosphatidylglycerophosphate/cardiolipin synthase-like enzyme